MKRAKVTGANCTSPARSPWRGARRALCAHAASQCTEGQESCLKKVPQSREKRDGYALDEKTSGYPGMGGTVAEGEPASRTEGSRTKKMVPKTGNTMLPNRGNTILQKVPKKREEG